MTSIELQFNLLKLRANGQVESKYVVFILLSSRKQRYYCEINIFVTAAPKEETSHIPLLRVSSLATRASNVRPAFTAEELYGNK